MSEPITLTISLPENPSTGYGWQLSGIGEYELKLSHYSSGQVGELVGGGGIRLFVFEIPLDQDDVLIEATYRQPWEGGGVAREVTIYSTRQPV